MSEKSALELREQMEHVTEEHHMPNDWRKHIALSTALIAVLAAIASLFSEFYSNHALLKKNDAIFAVSKASDAWNLYQSKNIKAAIDESFYEEYHEQKFFIEAAHYRHDQDSIGLIARGFERESVLRNVESDELLAHHHKLAVAVTFFEIAIGMSAISALLMRKKFWYFSLGLAALGMLPMIYGFL